MNKLIWTEEKIREKASEFKLRSHFQKEYGGAYHAAVNLGILEDLGFEVPGNKYKRCIYVIEFDDNHAYVGLTYNFNKRMEQHFNNKSIQSPPRKHYEVGNSKYKCIQLTSYLNLKEAQQKEKHFINLYIKNNWNILNKGPGGQLGGRTAKWNKEEIFKLASTYDNMVSLFNSKDKQAYDYASKHGFAKDLVYKNPKKTAKKPIEQFDLNGNYIKEFESAYQAAKELSLTASCICNCCNNKLKTHGKFKWKYKAI